MCHWPQAGILQDLLQPQDHIAPASLFSSLPQGTNPILFQLQTTQPTRTTPSPSPSPPSLRHPTCNSSSQSPHHLHLIQTQDNPRPASHPAMPNSGPLRIVPSPVFVQARGLPAPATHPDQDQPSSRLKLICPCMSYRRGPACPKERGVAGPAALADTDISAPVGLGHGP